MTYLIIYIVQGIIFGIATNKIIENKGYYENWFWWGFFFGMIALIIALSKPEKRSYHEQEHLIRTSEEIRTRDILHSGGWKCAFCYNLNENFVTTCSCGKRKEDSERHNRQAAIERENLAKQKAAVKAKAETKTESLDPYEEVKKAKELLDMGIISREEFDKKKAELLGL